MRIMSSRTKRIYAARKQRFDMMNDECFRTASLTHNFKVSNQFT